MRTPSRNQAGLELLMEYYNQLYYLDQRFFPLHGNLGVHFHWYGPASVGPSCRCCGLTAPACVPQVRLPDGRPVLSAHAGL